MTKAQEYVLAPSSQHPHHCSTSYLFLLFFPSLSSMQVVVLCFQLQLLLTVLYALSPGIIARRPPLLVVFQGEAENLQAKPLIMPQYVGERMRCSGGIPNLRPSDKGEARVFLHSASNMGLKSCENGYRACTEAAAGEVLPSLKAQS